MFHSNLLLATMTDTNSVAIHIDYIAEMGPRSARSLSSRRRQENALKDQFGTSPVDGVVFTEYLVAGLL